MDYIIYLLLFSFFVFMLEQIFFNRCEKLLLNVYSVFSFSEIVVEVSLMENEKKFLKFIIQRCNSYEEEEIEFFFGCLLGREFFIFFLFKGKKRVSFVDNMGYVFVIVKIMIELLDVFSRLKLEILVFIIQGVIVGVFSGFFFVLDFK